MCKKQERVSVFELNSFFGEFSSRLAHSVGTKYGFFATLKRAQIAIVSANLNIMLNEILQVSLFICK